MLKENQFDLCLQRLLTDWDIDIEKTETLREANSFIATTKRCECFKAKRLVIDDAITIDRRTDRRTIQLLTMFGEDWMKTTLFRERTLNTDRQTDRQTDRLTDKFTPIYPPKLLLWGYNK
ncbi:hypothetical protein DPMN_054440 [Dreissena polymorpha]|uniref:Uncharacterized protein n=1 Tax=Dreissena polymorpha TaxID=45954 RepID=A0A9D4CQC3_DREPO|nr:hypothetical protein DPMN_054440 [Dreissena polymorpha]